jgi:MFS family permease
MFTHAEPTTADVSTTQKDVRAYAWVVFALTVGLLLSDYMSRQVLNAVFPMLKATWNLSDTRLGSLSSVVALMVGVLTFPLSVLADRWGRVRSIVLMAAMWSLATLGCALSTNYNKMLLARAFVGVGEAAYGSVGIAVVLSIFRHGCAQRSPPRSWPEGRSVQCSAWRSGVRSRLTLAGARRSAQWQPWASCCWFSTGLPSPKNSWRGYSPPV